MILRGYHADSYKELAPFVLINSFQLNIVC